MNHAAVQAAAGGIYFDSDRVLLVQVKYGRNKGMWMLPGGLVEAGESIEEAAIREIKEETGLQTKVGRMVGVRSGVQHVEGALVTSVYFVFEVHYVSGTLKKDEHEIDELRLWSIHDVESSNEIVELSKEMIISAWSTANGLYQGSPVQTNSRYTSYSYYIPNNVGSRHPSDSMKDTMN